MKFNEYSLKLSSTGENLLVAEISSSMLGDLNKSKIEEVLDKCIQIPKDLIEEAKLGNTDKFQKYLKTPAVGVMIKLNKFCRFFNDCVMADRRLCNTKNVALSKKSIPICWEHGEPTKVGTILSSEEEFSTLIVHYFNEKRIGVISMD